MLVPTTCFNCESACGLLAYVDSETLEVRKFEGNPEHPGSRGRNCAKGPATLNQITDPDRVLHPLKRAGARGEGRWERVTWDDALDDIARRIRRAIVEERENEVMYHVGRPGEDGYTERVLAAWGVDGHNSHTNICSSGGRSGYAWWMGLDRPSPDHANAERHPADQLASRSRALFQPARAAHHRRQVQRRQTDRRRRAALEHRDPRRSLARARIRAAKRRCCSRSRATDRHRPLRSRVRPPVVELGGVPRGSAPRRTGHLRDVRARARAISTRRTRSNTRRPRPASPSRPCARSPSSIAGCRARGSRRTTWRSAAAGNLGGWQVARTLFLLNALTRRGRRRRRRLPQRLEQVRPQADLHAAASQALERADLAAGVPARA